MTAPAPEAAPATEAVEETPANTPQGRSPEEEAAHWKKMAREQESRAKANSKAAEELAKIREAQMSAEEKAAKDAELTRQELENIRAENIRYKAAALHGISEEYFDLLGTGSEEEILIRAERIGELEDAANELAQLKAAIAAQAQQAGDEARAPGAPVASLKPGNPSVKDDSYPSSWFPQMNTRTRKEA
jgi:alanyl-tRNA synthetase